MSQPDALPVVLAAGLARRMGRPKLTLEVGGQTVLERAVATVRATTGRDPLVVTPAEGPVRAVAERLGVVVALNPDPARGLSSSLGIAAAAAGRRGLLVFLGDQPEPSREAVRTVMDTLAAHPEAWMVDVRFGETPGHPVFVSWHLYPQVWRLSGDRGARALSAACPPGRAISMAMAGPAPGDIDTPGDWDQFRARDGASSSGATRRAEEETG